MSFFLPVLPVLLSLYFKLVPMRKIVVFSLLLCSALFASAQKAELAEDGLYYLNGKEFTGAFTETDEQGLKVAERLIVNGLEDGITTLFFPDGKIKEQRSFKKGLKDGTWITWNSSGVKTAEAGYKNDKKDGFWYVWDDNGVKRYEMFYEKGDKKGTWMMWDENGKMIMEKKY